MMLYQIGTIELWEFKGNDLALKHADGTLTVSKFMHAVSRGTNNVIRLNGHEVLGSPLTQEELDEINGNN